MGHTLTHRFLLGIFESILGVDPELSQKLVSKTTIMQWLLKRIEAKSHDGNRSYASEILSVLLDNRQNRLAFGKADGVEVSLKVLSVSSFSGLHLKSPSDNCVSNFGNEILSMEMKKNTWRTSLTPSVQLCRSQKSRSCSLMLKA